MKTKTNIDVRNPRTGELDYAISATSANEIATFADVMRLAQKTWHGLGMEARCTSINQLADAIEKHSETIIKALETDTGRRKIATQEVMGVIGSLRGWALKAPDLMPQQDWQQGQMKPNFKHTNQFVPYALVGVISPWNFPMTLSFIDAIPALLAGGCVMIKPSEVTPRFADALTPAIAEAGMQDVLRFIQGDGRTGAALIDHMDCICFTIH